MTKQMSVPASGMNVLMNLLGQDVGFQQFLRELNKNSEESFTRNPDLNGERKVIWKRDEIFFKQRGIPKLCLIDNGIGMYPHELENYINNLSSSGGIHGLHANYGLGAKISAATVNHHGVIYQSWKNGKGYMVHLWRDPKTGVYGLREFDKPNTSSPYIYKIPANLKPTEIKDHGTKVILLGMYENDNTFNGKEITWVPRYLNSKFFKLPKDIDFKYEHDGTKKEFRTIDGMEGYLNLKSVKKGTLKLEDVDIHWWILQKGMRDSRSHQDKGHVAALYQDELYDIRVGYYALSQFGIAFGTSRVVIYAEPKGVVTANTARSSLLLDYDPMLGAEGKGDPLPWEEWGRIFYRNMPQELKDLQAEEQGDKDNNSANIKELLSRVKEYFDISRKSFSKGGINNKGIPSSDLSDDLTSGEGASGSGAGSDGNESGGVGTFKGSKGRGPGASKNKKTSSEDNPYCGLSSDEDGEAYTSKNIDGPMPQYLWIKNPNDIEDKGLTGYAATYNPVTNWIFINYEFGGFRDLRAKLLSKSTTTSTHVEMAIENSIEKWFGLSLIEAVVGINCIRNVADWDSDQVAKALSNESLTTMCMQRYFTVQNIKRETGPSAKYFKTSEDEIPASDIVIQ